MPRKKLGLKLPARAYGENREIREERERNGRPTTLHKRRESEPTKCQFVHIWLWASVAHGRCRRMIVNKRQLMKPESVTVMDSMFT